MNNKTQGRIHFFLPTRKTSVSLAQVVNSIKGDSRGYAGFGTKRLLQEHLAYEMFEVGQNNTISEHDFDAPKVLLLIKRTLLKCSKKIPIGIVHVYIFPTLKTFVAKKMGGSTGYTPWRNTILLYVHPFARRTRSVEGSMAHEYAHAAMLRYHRWDTLLDSIIFEGMAEHFREDVVGGGRAPWTKVLNVNQSAFAISRLRKSLNSRSPKLYQDVFWGSKKFPLWTGYTIGYNIVGSFLRRNTGLSWSRLIRLTPQQIYGGSEFAG